MKITIIDGHPGEDRLITAMLDRYAAGAEAAGAQVTRIDLRQMSFDPVLSVGYRGEQPLEPDLETACNAITDCNHLVIGFPLWWGAQPALLKGFFDRVLLPGFAFKYHKNDPFWDRLLAGRSADVFITGDTPGFYLRLKYGSPVIRQMKGQVLGFCGFKPVKTFYHAPVRKKPREHFAKWLDRAEARGRAMGSR